MNHQLHFDLSAAARRTMLAHGFEPDYPPAIAAQLEQLRAHPPQPDPTARDMRSLLWSSIDNDTSKDLDQIEYVETLPNGSTRVLIGIADVDAFVPKGSPIDQHALRETTTVYTGVDIFSMLPEELSTGSTSLLQDQERLAVVGDFTIDAQAHVVASELYLARVLNKAQLAYPSIGAWLAGQPAPPKVAASPDLQQQLHLQDQIAQRLLGERDSHGALNLETIETHPIHLTDGEIDIEADTKNRATQIIEDFMIAANGAVARMLDAKGYSSIRRVVRTPETLGAHRRARRRSAERSFPPSPIPNRCTTSSATSSAKIPTTSPISPSLSSNSSALANTSSRTPGQQPIGHFGLAVQDYTHSTAPNRRYADLVIQRIVKAMIAGKPSPYSDDELASIAAQCTRMEDAERKVSREMQKRIAAVAMSSRIGQTFDAIVTGVNRARLLRPHPQASRRWHAGPGCAGCRCRRPPPCVSRANRSGPGLHRLRPRLSWIRRGLAPIAATHLSRGLRPTTWHRPALCAPASSRSSTTSAVTAMRPRSLFIAATADSFRRGIRSPTSPTDSLPSSCAAKSPLANASSSGAPMAANGWPRSSAASSAASSPSPSIPPALSTSPSASSPTPSRV